MLECPISGPSLWEKGERRKEFTPTDAANSWINEKCRKERAKFDNGTFFITCNYNKDLFPSF